MTSKKKLGVIDYGSSNIFNVVNAFEYLGHSVEIIASETDFNKYTHLVLPGVGSFQDGMNSLESRNLVKPLLSYTKTNKPFLGICLGMQMMLEMSYEFGEHKGLGIIRGDIQKIPSKNLKGEKHKIPHIGWNNLQLTREKGADNRLIDSRLDTQAMYFVHSYMANCNKKNIIATCDYNGIIIPAVIMNNNNFGCQFHPEKSGIKGLSILTNFVNL